MQNVKTFFQDLYKNFNDRNIESVISHLTEDVTWANGMEGGHVHGRNGVREYWTRQFALVRSEVTPVEIQSSNGQVRVRVHQVVHDLEGKLIADEIVYHLFQLRGEQIAAFHIEDRTE